MAEDMRETIANAAKTLLFDKKVRKLTVKDIVEECHITRQTFYYHFEDIPDLMAWSLRRNFDRVIAQCQTQKNGEEALRYLLSAAVNARPMLKKGMQSNYGEELERQLEGLLMDFLSHVAASRGLSASPMADALGSVAPFAEQMFLPKRFDNERLVAAWPSRPAVRSRALAAATCAELVRTRWGRVPVGAMEESA